MKITEYEKITSMQSDEMLLIDGNRGTKTIAISDFAKDIIEHGTPEQRRVTPGGRNLGTSFTAAQRSVINDGSFKGFLVGDYWQSGNIKYRIADMDYWFNCGDTPFTKHHLVIVPDTNLYTAQMHNTESGAYESGSEANTTAGGYANSDMRTTNLERAKTMVKEFFGDAVLTHREYLTNAVTNGYPSGGAWFDSDVELMNEIMIYGSYIFTPAGNGAMVPNRYTIDKQQLALFALCPKMITNGSWYWLRDVVSSSYFAGVGSHGSAGCSGASRAGGVRPVITVG